MGCFDPGLITLLVLVGLAAFLGRKMRAHARDRMRADGEKPRRTEEATVSPARKAVGCVSLLIAVFCLLNVGVVGRYTSPQGDAQRALTSALLPVQLTLGLFALLISLSSWRGVDHRSVVGDFPEWNRILRTALTAIPLVAVGLAAGALYSAAMLSFVPRLAQRLLESPRWAEAPLVPLAFAVGSLGAVVIGPAFEEYLFRGILLRWLARKRGAAFGLWLSASLFAVLHPPSPVGAFLHAWVFGVLYLETRSLYVPLLLHSLYNALALGVQLLGITVWIDALESVQGLLRLAVCTTPPAVVWLVLFFRRHPPPQVAVTDQPT